MPNPYPQPSDRVGYVHGGVLVEFRDLATDVLLWESALQALPQKDDIVAYGVGEGSLVDYEVQSVRFEFRKVEVDDEQGDPQDVGTTLCYVKPVVYITIQ